MNLLLQHWHDPFPPEIVRLSCEAMARYAIQVGAEYRLVIGHPFLNSFSPQAQKLHVLSEEWDSFEDVAIVDSDMFPVRGLTENLFAVPGHGFHQKEAHRRVCAKFLSAHPSGAFYGGCLYKFNRRDRKRLRDFINFDELKQFDNPTGGWDEGMMHRLCVLAGLYPLYLSDRWCYGSPWPDPIGNGAKFIHIRTRPSKDKLTNLKALQAAGIIP